MIIKCPECGLEYSYGRNICHICERNTILFGSIFIGPRQTYQWNCESQFGCKENPMNKVDSSREFIEITPKENNLKVEEIIH
ncbi:MAG: hypothetical protein ACFE96_01105 [Candidatus Hermodarchaeota archaeon]